MRLSADAKKYFGAVRKMARKKNWQKLLAETVQKHIDHNSCDYKVSDCFKIPDDVVTAITGRRINPEIRYSSKTGAAKQLKKLKVKSVEEIFASRFEEIPPVQAKRGDIGVVDCDGAIAGGVFTALGFMTVGPETGIVFLPFQQVKTAFKVE